MNNLTYLYVEDDTLSREALILILTRLLKLEHVYTFEDSSDFLARVGALPTKPDIFLLDIHVEPLTGFEMLKLLRQDARYRDAKIVAITASVMSEEVQLLKESGFDGVIGKPINAANFPNILQRIIAGEEVWHIIDN